MIQIPLQAIPNQSFNIALDGNDYDFYFKEINGGVACSIGINQTQITKNLRVAPFAPLIPYHYLENGNFMLFTQAYQLPAWRSFQLTQFLYYFSAADLAAYRARPQPSFNTDVDLPLRYKPQGYKKA